MPPFEFWLCRGLLMLRRDLRFPKCLQHWLTFQMQLVSQDHPPRKRWQTHRGSFTVCWLQEDCPCSLSPASASYAAWEGTQGNKRSLLMLQEEKLTWLTFPSSSGVSKLTWAPGKILKHCHQKLEFMIMTPGLKCRKGLRFILTRTWRKPNRVLFMLPWTMPSLEWTQDRQKMRKKNLQNMHPYVWGVESSSDPKQWSVNG